MSSMEDGRNGFKKGKQQVEKTEFYQKLRGPVQQDNNGEKELFSKAPEDLVGDDATISMESLKKLLYAYGQLLGIGNEKLESIIEGSKQNGDAYLAKIKFTYAQMCKERGFVPRGYKG